MVYKYFDNESSSEALKHANKSVIKSDIMSNQQLAEEFHKPIIKTPENHYSSFENNAGFRQSLKFNFPGI